MTAITRIDYTLLIPLPFHSVPEFLAGSTIPGSQPFTDRRAMLAIRNGLALGRVPGIDNDS